VRFLLSPPPEETMSTRSSQREPRVVLPTAPKEEEAKFGSGSKWGREQLRLLGVDFLMKRRIDLNQILKGVDWSPEAHERITSLFSEAG
jgi:hypothetical protein